MEDTVYAALSTLADVLHKNPHATQQFLEKKGIDKTVGGRRFCQFDDDDHFHGLHLRSR